MSLIEEAPTRAVRMAHLAVVGTHSTNGVAEIHSELLRTRVLRDFAEMYPERFNNKTNGVTPRRWLLAANPRLSRLITEAIGDGWITDLSAVAGPRALRRRRRPPRAVSARPSGRRRSSSSTGCGDPTGIQVVDPETIFDSQIKRIHEYKRQLLNVLHIVVLYNRLRQRSEPSRSRRARSSSPARRRRRIASPSSSSS